MAGLCTPWGPPERTRPLRKRLEPNLPEDPSEDLNIRNDENLQVPTPYESPMNYQNVSMQYAPVRGRTPQRGRNDIHSQSPSLPPVSQNAPDDPRRDGLDNYLYVNDNHGLSKSTENFSVSESDMRAKRKVFLSGDHVGRSGSFEKFSAERSPYSSSYQFGNSNLSLATEGDTTWREWAMGRGSGDDPRPRWGDRGINTGGHPWNPGGQIPPMGRNGDNLGPNEEYPTPGWVERGLSRMSGDGRGRGGSAESLRVDPGVRVIVSDEMNGNQRQRNSLGELQNVPYGHVSGTNDMYPSRNFDGHSSAIPYVGEMPSMHSSSGMYNRGGGSVIEGNRGERVIVVGRDVYNASEVVNSGRPYGHNSCISAPNNKPPIPRYKKNEEMTSSLPNLQSTNTHLRGQNVPVDPDVVMEREMRRMKAIELQKAIRQQLEDREKRKLQEKEQRLKEERQIEERLRQQQEAERMKREEEERKLREKEEMENKKAEIMREALEAAEHDAQKQRKKRSAHLIEEKVPQVEPNKANDDAVSVMDPDEPISNYIISSCCPVITEGTPNPIVRQQEGAPNDVDRVASAHLKLDRSVATGGRDPLDYEQSSYNSPTNPVAPFKITLPETSMVGGGGGGHFEGGDGADNRQGGVLIVGRDVYLLPYVNTDILAPRQINNSTYSIGAIGGIEDMGNRILASGDQCDLGREWIGGSHRVRPSKDATTQTEPSTQGPLLLLLRMAGPDDSQTGSEQRSSTDDSSIPENESKDVKGKNVGKEPATPSSDCCFCQKGRSQSQPSSSKGSTHDCQQKQPQQIDSRPKWGANRPTKRYTTQSEKDPHYSCRSSSQKRQSVGRQKRETVDPATTEEGSEDPEQTYKPQARSKSKIEPPASTSNTSAANGNARNPTPRNKRQTGKKSSTKSNDTKRTSPQSSPPVSQTPLPVLTSTRTTAPRRVQVVKPSLSLDQDFLGQSDHHFLESSRIPSSYFPSTQLTHMPMLPDCKHMPLPVLPPLHQSRLSPIRITQTPLAPIRISPTPPLRMYSTPLGQIRTSPSPTPSLNRYTQTPTPTTPAPEPPTPTSPTPTYQPPQNNRQCGSPPVPAVLSKMLREQAKSPPRQFSFISTAPHREEKPPLHSRKNSRANTPLLKPQTPSAKLPSPRPESKNTVVLITPSDEPAKNTPVLKAMAPAMPSPVREDQNSALLVTPREKMSIGSPSLNLSCHSPSSVGDNSNALMLVTMSEDISVGSPIANLPANTQMSMLEIDDNRSMGLVTPSDEISVGLDSRSNFSISRASQISNEGMPEGFWEDLGSSLQASSPFPDTSISESIPEHGNNEEKTNDVTVVIDESDRDKNTKVIGRKIDESPKNSDSYNAEQKTKSEKKEKQRCNEAGGITDPENGEIPVMNSLVGVHKTPKLERCDEIRGKSNKAAKEKAVVGEVKKTGNQPIIQDKKDDHESGQESDDDVKKNLVQKMENVYLSQKNVKEKANIGEGQKTENQPIDQDKKGYHESGQESDDDVKKNLVQKMENVYLSQKNVKEKANIGEGQKTENQPIDQDKKGYHESGQESDDDVKKNLVQKMENVYLSQKNVKEKANIGEGQKTENQPIDQDKKGDHESGQESDDDVKKNLVQKMESVYLSQKNVKEKADIGVGQKTGNQPIDQDKKDDHNSGQESDDDVKKNLVQKMENVYLTQKNVKEKANIGEVQKTENQPIDQDKKGDHESDQESDDDLKKNLVQKMENVYLSQRNVKEKADIGKEQKTENQPIDQDKKDDHNSGQESDDDVKKNLVQKMENVYLSQRNVKEKADIGEGQKTENQPIDQDKKDDHESDQESDDDLKKNLVQRMENVYLSQRNVKEKADIGEGQKTENQPIIQDKKDDHESDQESDDDLKKNLVQKMENVYLSQKNVKEKADIGDGQKTRNQLFDQDKKDDHASDQESDDDLKKNLVQRMENVYLSQRNVESKKNSSPKKEDKTIDEVILRADDVGAKKETVEVSVLDEGKHPSSESKSSKGDVSGQSEAKENIRDKGEDDVKKGNPSGSKEVVASGSKTGSAEGLKTEEGKDSLIKSKKIKSEDDGNVQSNNQGQDVDSASTQCLLPFLLPHYEGRP